MWETLVCQQSGWDEASSCHPTSRPIKHYVGTTVRSPEPPRMQAAAFCHGEDGGDATRPASYGASDTVSCPSLIVQFVHFRSSPLLPSTPRAKHSSAAVTDPDEGSRRRRRTTTERGRCADPRGRARSRGLRVPVGAGFVVQDQRHGRNGKLLHGERNPDLAPARHVVGFRNTRGRAWRWRNHN